MALGARLRARRTFVPFCLGKKEPKNQSDTLVPANPLFRPCFGAAAHDHVMLGIIGTGLGRRALPRPENGLRDLPALRYVAGLRLPDLGCGEGMIVAWLWKRACPE